jgi:hypothetical protein
MSTRETISTSGTLLAGLWMLAGSMNVRRRSHLAPASDLRFSRPDV